MGKIEDLEVINGEGYQLTTLDKAIGLARANSVWPLPFATSCCGIEFMATMGSAYDLSRFGMERMSFSPRQADLLIVAGTISKKLGPVLKRVYEQMAEPKWVITLKILLKSMPECLVNRASSVANKALTRLGESCSNSTGLLFSRKYFPISTPSSKTVEPDCSILYQPVAVGTKPKPSEPIAAPLCITQFAPI